MDHPSASEPRKQYCEKEETRARIGHVSTKDSSHENRQKKDNEKK